MRTPTAIALTILALFAASVVAQGPRRDGKWEVTMEMQMEGMPQAMPPRTTTHCVTPEEAKDPQKAIPQNGGRGRGMAESCKVSDQKTVGSTVSWSIQCDGPPPVTGHGEITYATDSYVGTMKMDRGGRSMTMKYTGKRLGDCDQK
jgi:hypothetical protein